MKGSSDGRSEETKIILSPRKLGEESRRLFHIWKRHRQCSPLFPVEYLQVLYLINAFEGVYDSQEKVGNDLTGKSAESHQFVVNVE